MGAFQDITGQQFERWTVVKFYGMAKSHGSKWMCRCRCGTERVIPANVLKQGRSRSCGCLAGELTRARITVDLTGLKFGRWTVLRQNAEARGASQWECICDCGAESVVFGAALRKGMSTSCGCLKAELAGTHSITHGMTDSAEYRTWCAAKARCYNPNNDRYENYGGRGISMCEEWRNSFAAFYRDMGPRPDGAEIDRIDNDENYEKGNCRWVTKTANMRNRQNAIYVTHEGKTLPLKEWAERTGIGYYTLVNRLKAGVTPLFAPVGTIKRHM